MAQEAPKRRAEPAGLPGRSARPLPDLPENSREPLRRGSQRLAAMGSQNELHRIRQIRFGGFPKYDQLKKNGILMQITGHEGSFIEVTCIPKRQTTSL